MSWTVTANLVTWVAALNPQVQGAAVSATATLVGIAGTAFVAVAGFRHARTLADTTLKGQRQQALSERRFAVYEDAVKYLLRLARLRPENYNFWSEKSGYALQEPEITREEHADIEARIVAWASPSIRALWKEMEEADHTADVGRFQAQFLRGEHQIVPRDPLDPQALEQCESQVNQRTHEAGRKRTGVIEAIRSELLSHE
ncbi:hypothetical protein OG943_14175 [Amycolatopsis sp. NBC_00345]|uniref:hypothetical protein n=1 Tax=Amycolatopsis sp. NBC_00345 TaxID=2975955 RepID=UPI002E273896